MSFCPGCGARLPEQARFCPGCGITVGEAPPADQDGSPPVPVGGTPRTPGTPPGAFSVSAPPWLTADWTLAAVCAFAFLLAIFAVGTLHGALMGFTALGGGGIGLGAIAGAYIPFVALGGDTVALVNNGGDSVYLSGSALLVTWLAVPVFFGRRVLRFGHARTGGTAAAWAFVAKLALLLGVGFGVAGGLAGTADPERFFDEDEGFRVVANVGAGEAGFWLVVLVLVLGAVSLRRSLAPAGRDLDAWRQVRSWGRTWGRLVLWGGLAWAGVALAAGVGLTVAAVIAADGTEERLLAVEVAPAVVVNAGVAGAAVASGASVETTSALVNLPLDIEADGSLSLFHFGFPPDDESGPAPLYVFPVLLLAPVALVLTTWRALQASRPPGEQEVLRVAFAVTGGFVLAAWLGSVLAPLGNAGGAKGGGTEIVRAAGARPSVGGTVGLALVWALAASLATALAWWNRRAAAAAEPAPSAPAPAEPPAAPAEPAPSAPAPAEPPAAPAPPAVPAEPPAVPAAPPPAAPEAPWPPPP